MAGRVLVVDDDVMIRDVVKTMLTAEGYEPVVAENGEAALKLLDQEARPVSLQVIVLDVMMPGMSGFDVLNSLKGSEDYKDLPVIMLTGEDRAEDIMTGYGNGADYYITKPFTRQQLSYGLKLVLGEETE